MMVGASLMTSAELRLQVAAAHLWRAVRCWPVVLSLTSSRNLPLDLLNLTDAVIESPGLIFRVKNGCSALGKTSCQAKKCADPLMQSASMPSCSTVGLFLKKPSRPTQCEENVPGWP